jgi:2-(1,2-epoxy-1,2-dihydrophenyl)acetyl-CoA isomerase
MEHVDVEIADGIGWMTIDRPDRFNAMDVGMAQEFREAGLKLARADDVRCAVVRATGTAFCSGVDLEYVHERGDDDDLSYLLPDDADATGTEAYGETFKQCLEYVHSGIAEIRTADRPFIAAVDGIAAAGGFGIAMCCDLVYASTDAAFEWAYHDTGLTGAESSTFFLPRLVGFREAMELMLRSPRLSPAEAEERGLINDVFDADGFDEEVAEIAAEIADGPAEAYGVAKSLINRASDMDRLDRHLDAERDNLTRIADGRNFEEGLEAFFEKRDPDFE